jgi:phosphoglycerate kinase
MNTLNNAPIKPGTRVLVRCDIDVPIKNGEILEEYRLDTCLETLTNIIQRGGRPVIAGHIGKPEGKNVPELSTNQLFLYFEEKLGEKSFELLENLRFDPREEANDPQYAKELASRAEIYVNESFATCHREHASIVGIPKILPSFSGCHLEKEIEILNSVLVDPQKPLTVIIGGAKLESKKPAVSKFLSIADYVLLGGKLGLAWNEAIPENLLLPTDYATDSCDLGPNTIAKYKEILNDSKTILWAGPVGKYEDPEFMKGTKEIAQTIATLTTEYGVFSVLGGGDTITAAEKLEVLTKFSFVSVGGSAMLQFLVDGTLPGIKALN